MDDDIKSALEIAMEKVEKLGEATVEERLKWKYLPQGKQLAAKYLKDKKIDLIFASDFHRTKQTAALVAYFIASRAHARPIALRRQQMAWRISH